MGKVNVVIVDATGNKEQKVGLPDDIKCGIIMVKLVEKIKLPSVGPDGNPISYKFIHKVTGRQLLEAQTLGEAGIKDGDVLRLQPEITAGAVCAQCGNNEADGNAFCSKCGTPMSAPAAQPTYTPVQPTYQANAYTPANTTNDKSKLILILGIVAVSLFMFGHLVLELGDIDYDDGIYNFLYFLIYGGQACFISDQKADIDDLQTQLLNSVLDASGITTAQELINRIKKRPTKHLAKPMTYMRIIVKIKVMIQTAHLFLKFGINTMQALLLKDI